MFMNKNNLKQNCRNSFTEDITAVTHDFHYLFLLQDNCNFTINTLVSLTTIAFHKPRPRINSTEDI